MAVIYRSEHISCQVCSWMNDDNEPATQRVKQGNQIWYLCDRHVLDVKGPAVLTPIFAHSAVLDSLEPDDLA